MGNRESDVRNTRFYGLKVSKSTDADIIGKLDSVENVQGYIKSLIRAGIKKEVKTMKRFYIKGENLDQWGSGCDEETIVTEEDVEQLAVEWEKPIDELLDQLIEIERTWFVVDDAISTRGEIFDRALHTTDKAEAMKAALGEWNHLTRSEQENRDAFYIAFGDTDRDGHINFETASETISIMKEEDKPMKLYEGYNQDGDHVEVVLEDGHIWIVDVETDEKEQYNDEWYTEDDTASLAAVKASMISDGYRF